MTRLPRIAPLAVVIAVVVTTPAVAKRPPAAPEPPCAQGVSSIGPAVLIDGHLQPDLSDLTAHVEACLPERPAPSP